MDWSSNHKIITAQLNSSSPERVFDALEEYGRALAGELAGGFDFLEQTLAARNNKLIDLGLAKNGFDGEIVAGLYMRARCGSDDPLHDKAIRLACLLNANAAGVPGFDALVLLEGGALDRLIQEGDSDEISALMNNSRRRKLVAQAFGKTGPFAEIENSRWLGIVVSAAGNPSLTFDDSNEYGPDLRAMDIQESILLLVQQAPVDSDWAGVIDRILFQMDPEKLRLPSSEAEAKELLARWGNLHFEGEGYYTHLPNNDEFKILLSIMFGGYMVNLYDHKIIGSDTDLDQARRCAYYARSPMTVEIMESARIKDGRVFLFAAVFNNVLHNEPVRRNCLESMLSQELRLLYDQRYKIQANMASNEQTFSNQLDSVASGLAEIKSQIQSIKSYLLIGVISLVLLILFKH